MNRRTLLRYAGTGLRTGFVVGIAGCSDDSNGTDEGSDGSDGGMDGSDGEMGSQGESAGVSRRKHDRRTRSHRERQRSAARPHLARVQKLVSAGVDAGPEQVDSYEITVNCQGMFGTEDGVYCRDEASQ